LSLFAATISARVASTVGLAASVWHFLAMNIPSAVEGSPPTAVVPSNDLAPACTLTGGILVAGGVAVVMGTGFSSKADLAESALLIGGGGLLALGVLLVSWLTKQRPTGLAAINAAPSLWVWWVSIILDGNLDSTSPGRLEIMIDILMAFGVLWAFMGSVFVVLYAKQGVKALSATAMPAKGSGSESMTRYQRWMVAVTAFGGVATILAVFLATLLR
jgi:hypothetical protein